MREGKRMEIEVQQDAIVIRRPQPQYTLEGRLCGGTQPKPSHHALACLTAFQAKIV
jgi:hypothetical protein